MKTKLRKRASEIDAVYGEVLRHMEYAPITLVYADPYFGIKDVYAWLCDARFHGGIHIDAGPYINPANFVDMAPRDRDIVCLDPCVGLRQIDRVAFMDAAICAANPGRCVVIVSADTEAFVLASWCAIQHKRMPYDYMIHNEIIMENDKLRHYCQKNMKGNVFDNRMRNPHNWRMELFAVMEDED